VSLCTVLGGTGYVGKNLVSYLRSLGHDVTVPERNRPNISSQVAGHVFYCIGMTADFRTRPFDTVRGHVSLLSDVLEHGEFDSLLYLSSTRIYQGNHDGHEDSGLVVNPLATSDLYNISKIMGESLCVSSGRANVRIARLSNVVGRQVPQSDNFLPTLSREARAGKITLQTAKTSVKDYIHIDDVVGLLARIAFDGRETVYNVASGMNVMHSEIIDRLAALTQCMVEVLPDAPVIAFPQIQIQRIVKEFGFSPRSVLSIFNTMEDI